MISLVCEGARAGHGIRVLGNRIGGRGGSVDLSPARAALRLAKCSARVRLIGYLDRSSRCFSGERAAGAEKEWRARWIRRVTGGVHHNSIFLADSRQHVFLCGGLLNAPEL